MVSKTLLFLASLTAAVTAAPCKPPSTGAPTLPSTGATDLAAPTEGLTLKAIAVGHGIQNYTCASDNATVTAAGALAALYDVTALYPGTPDTGLPDMAGFNSLSTILMWTQNIPLNLVDPAAASPGSQASPNSGLPPSAYGAQVENPFKAPADVTVGSSTLPFLGLHYFDAAGSPTFDLSAKSLKFSVALKSGVDAPATSDKGVLSTGAVKWLQLGDNGKGLGNTPGGLVYRVITAGGVGQACSVPGAVPKGSVPYTAFYWFFA